MNVEVVLVVVVLISGIKCFDVLFLFSTMSLRSCHLTIKYAFMVMLKSLSFTLGMSLMSTPTLKVAKMSNKISFLTPTSKRDQ